MIIRLATLFGMIALLHRRDEGVHVQVQDDAGCGQLRITFPHPWIGQGIELSVVKLPQAKREFVLLPRRWVVELSFAWVARFSRLVKDYERLPQTVAALHRLVFASLMLTNVLGSA